QWVYTSGITNSSAALHWGQVSGAAYYVVEWRAAGGTWNQLQGGPWTNTTAEITGLQTNTTYEWHVKTYCTDGRTSDWSSVTSFTTLGDECGLPFFRYTLPITDSTATFNWTAVDGALNYSVQYRLANGVWVDVPGSPTTDLNITVTGLLPDTLYEWHMKVNCSNGASTKWLASLTFRTSNTSGCNKPGGLYTDSLALTSVRLNWASVQGAETYSVDIRVWPNGAWNAVAGSPVDTNFIVLDSLIPHTTYEWRVRTNCAGGLHSFYSNTFQFKTDDLPSCSAPDHLASDSITETTAILHWSPVPGALGYKGQIRLPNGVYIDVGGLMTDTSVLVTGLTPHTTYDWHVKTKCSDEHFSNWSSSATFTTTGNGVPNDECANAKVLTVNDTCVSTFASNVDATPSVPSPVGGCSSIGNKDVWFKFTMPNVLNPTVTIRASAGSLANAVMEVYSGTDCNILSVITCEDNNDNGNGSLMPVINLTGTPGVTIWVRVWGFEGATGTFTICVLNYVTFNYVGAPHVMTPVESDLYDDLGEIVQAPVDMKVQPQMRITPNPASEHLNVIVQQTDESRVIGLRLLDYSGKEMIKQEIEPVVESQFKTSIDVSALAPGMYVMQVQTTSGMMVEKVTVVR
ncbi:MAG: T9SS type A sorting domain-containing protein, partial [Saprospiraceae bacterium]